MELWIGLLIGVVVGAVIAALVTRDSMIGTGLPKQAHVVA